MASTYDDRGEGDVVPYAIIGFTLTVVNDFRGLFS